MTLLLLTHINVTIYMHCDKEVAARPMRKLCLKQKYILNEFSDNSSISWKAVFISWLLENVRVQLAGFQLIYIEKI